MPDPVELLRAVTEAALASPWLLAVIVGMAVVDALLPVVPSEALIIAAGVAAVTGEQDLVAVIAAAATGSFLGECAGYLVGRRIGPAVRHRFPAEHYHRAACLLERRGGLVLLTARFVPAGRTVATLASGATGYPAARFVGFTAVGTVLSAAWQALLGFVGGAAFAHDTVTALAVGFGFATLVGAALEGGRRLIGARRASLRVVQRRSVRWRYERLPRTTDRADRRGRHLADAGPAR
ncbi:DedA family protein [Pseudonocardia broussonetiae]|uniref:DedA family protein n=1 Tax=Pseudonocardia broussonetiae TaxID=2736640 RepID=A0A6M6JB49_9PSEU|nr:DedA family protein [Pseudonocardia broussonetiae]QJY45168.1 DedA family protein [Pseudonocardia broussonetiae]